MANVTAIQPVVIKDACNNSCPTLSQPDYVCLHLWIPLTIASCTATAIMLIFSIGMSCYACYMKRQLVGSRRLAVDGYIGPQELDVEFHRLGPEIERDNVILIDTNPLRGYEKGRRIHQQIAGPAGHAKPPRPQPCASLPVVTAEHEPSRHIVSVGEPFTPSPALLRGGGLIAVPARPLGKCPPSPAADRKQQEQPPKLPLRLGKDKDSGASQAPSETSPGSIGTPTRSSTESYRASGDDSGKIVPDHWPKPAELAEHNSDFGLPYADRSRTPLPREPSVPGRLSGSQLERSDRATESYIVALAWPDGDDYDDTEAVLEMHRAKSRQQEQSGSSLPTFNRGKSPDGSDAPSETLPVRGNSPARSMAVSSVSSGVAASVEGRIGDGARADAGGFGSSAVYASGDHKIAPGSRPNSVVPPEGVSKPELPFAARTRMLPPKAPSVLRRQLSDSLLDRRCSATRSYITALPSPDSDDYDYSDELVDVQKELSRRRSLAELRQSETYDYDYDYCRARQALPLLLCTRADRLRLHAPPRPQHDAATGIGRYSGAA